MFEKKLVFMATLFSSFTTFASPLVIAHRGSSGYRPEHTLEAYRLAIEQGADFIEPDLVATKDGVLIARHENEISGTTNVAEKFPEREKTKTIDGEKIKGWFSEDFTLAEIKTLRAKERLAIRDQQDNFKYPVATFAEILTFVSEQQKLKGRTIGLVPELKHPAYFKSIGLRLENTFATQIKEAKLDKADSPMIVQCFELATLKELKKQVGTRLFFLLEGTKILSDNELKDLAKTIYGVGPEKSSLINADGSDNGRVAQFHKFGLKVIPYTFRKEEQFIGNFAKKDFTKELIAYYKLGVDGLFSDFPDLAVKARDEYLKTKK